MYIIVCYHTYIIWNATASADITGKMSPIALDTCFARIDTSIVAKHVPCAIGEIFPVISADAVAFYII